MIQLVIRETVQQVVRETDYILVEMARPGPPGPKGDPGLIWRGPWSDSADYVPGDVVSYQGSSWVAVEPVDGDPPTSNLGEWEPVAERGEDGDSAYQAWLDAGNSGSQQDFLDSLKGEQGDSAYQVAVSEGFSGDEAAWLASLVGAPGAAATITVDETITGEPGTDAEVTNTGTESAAVLVFTIPRGSPGTPGQEVNLRTDSGFIQWRLGDGEWQNLIELSVLAGADGREVELGTSDTHIRWRYVGDDAWADLVALDALKGDTGDPGREVELQTSETHIQWRYVGDPTWTDLIALSALEGDPGTDGRTILSGSGAPGDVGEDGDFYIDTTAWLIYGPKSGTWGSGTSLVGPAGASTWGAIGGTLSDQTDLQDALNAKADASSLAAVATSGQYSDLSGTPTLGTAAAANVGDFATSAQGEAAESALQPGDDLTELASTGATAGHVPKADGSGGIAWAAESGGGGPVAAEDVSYDPETSELEAEDVQAAIDELVGWINGLSWTAPNYPTAELPENPPPGEIAYDADEDRLVVGNNANEWDGYARLGEVGDVNGPGSSVDGELVVFDGETGKAIKAAPSGLAITSDAVVLSKQLVKHQGTASVVSTALAVDFLGPSRLIVTYTGPGAMIDLSGTNLAAGREVELLFNNVGPNPPQLVLPDAWQDAGLFPLDLVASQWVIVTLRSTSSDDSGVFVTVAPAAGGGGGSSVFAVVEHGANASETRPAVVKVEWRGSVDPNNKAVGDTWLNLPNWD